MESIHAPRCRGRPQRSGRGPASPAGVHDRPRRRPRSSRTARPNRRPARAAPASAWRLRAARGPAAELMGQECPEGWIVLDHQDRARDCPERGASSRCAVAGLAGRWEAEGPSRCAKHYRTAGGAWRRAREGPDGRTSRRSPRWLGTAPPGRDLRRARPGPYYRSPGPFWSGPAHYGPRQVEKPFECLPARHQALAQGFLERRRSPGTRGSPSAQLLSRLAARGPVSPLSLWRPRLEVRFGERALCRRCRGGGLGDEVPPWSRPGRAALDMGWTL